MVSFMIFTASVWKILDQPSYNEKRKMVNIFQNPEWKKVYATETNKSVTLENLDNEDSIDNNINEKWENIKTILMYG